MSAPIRAKFALLSEIYPPIDLDLDLNAIIYAQNGHISATSLFPVTRFEIKHSRIKMLGGAFTIARGNWLFKTEAAYFDGFEFSDTPNKEYSRLDGLAGVEYSGAPWVSGTMIGCIWMFSTVFKIIVNSLNSR